MNARLILARAVKDIASTCREASSVSVPLVSESVMTADAKASRHA